MQISSARLDIDYPTALNVIRLALGRTLNVPAFELGRLLERLTGVEIAIHHSGGFYLIFANDCDAVEFALRWL